MGQTDGREGMKKAERNEAMNEQFGKRTNGHGTIRREPPSELRTGCKDE